MALRGLLLLLGLGAGRAQLARLLPEYKTHRIEDLCAGTQGVKVELPLHNKPTVLILNSTLVLALRCHIELELHSDQFGFSVFTEEMWLDRTNDCSRDFYQFGRDFLVFTSHKGPKRCGQWEPPRRVLREDGSLLRLDYGRTPPAKREYVEDVDREMDLWLAVHPSARNQPPKQLKLVITPFKKQCAGDDHYYRKCPSNTGACIKRELFCDGQINCVGLQKDEQMEYCLQHLGSGVDMFLTIPIIILIVVFSIVGLMFLLFLIKMCAGQVRPKRRTERPTAGRGLAAQEQAMSLCPAPPRPGPAPPRPEARPRPEGRGLRALQAQLSSPPSAPEEEPPALPPSYSEAISTPHTPLHGDLGPHTPLHTPLYPCNPPKYTELPEDGSLRVQS